MIRTSQPQQDGYVECDECGNRIEDHDLNGCTVEGCPCRERWTVSEIQAVWRREGLPAGNPTSWLTA